MDMKYLVLILALYTCSSLTEAQTITVKNPATVHTLTGRDILLTCSVTGVSNPKVYWSDPSGFIHGKCTRSCLVCWMILCYNQKVCGPWAMWGVEQTGIINVAATSKPPVLIIWYLKSHQQCYLITVQYIMIILHSSVTVRYSYLLYHVSCLVNFVYLSFIAVVFSDSILNTTVHQIHKLDGQLFLYPKVLTVSLSR